MYFCTNPFVATEHEFVRPNHWIVAVEVHKYPYDKVLTVHCHRDQAREDNNPTLVIELSLAREGERNRFQ